MSKFNSVMIEVDPENNLVHIHIVRRPNVSNDSAFRVLETLTCKPPTREDDMKDQLREAGHMIERYDLSFADHMTTIDTVLANMEV